MVVDIPPQNDGWKPVAVMATASYNKFSPQKGKPFLVIKLQLHTVAIDKNSVLNTVLTRRRTAASRPSGNNIARGPRPAQQGDAQQKTLETLGQRITQAIENVLDKLRQSEKHTVERKVGHSGYGRKRQYSFRSYGYGSEDDTLESGKNILEHLGTKSNERDSCKQAN